MKSACARRLSIFTALLLLITVRALAADDGLKVSLRLEASRALIGIPVGSELILENRGKTPVRAPRAAYYRVHNLTTDEWTIARSLKGPYAVELSDSAPETIEPGQTVTIPDLPSTNLFSTILGGEALLRPATYKIDVLFSNSDWNLSSASDPEHSMQVAALFSEWMTPAVAFTVEEPRGEDALVWAKIAEVTQNGKSSLLATPEMPGEWIRPLVSEHPDSAYVPYLSDYYDYYTLDDRASAEFSAKWLARDLPPSVKEWLHLRRARALIDLARMSRADSSSRNAEDEALSIARQLAKHATVPGMKEDAQRIVDDIIERRTPSRDPDGD